MKYQEWQAGSGNYYCNDINELNSDYGKWYALPRLLGITPADFVSKLINEYKVDFISYNYDRNVLIYSWSEEHGHLAHKFVLDINKKLK